MKSFIVFLVGIVIGIVLFIAYTKETTIQTIVKPVVESVKSLPEFSIDKSPSDSIIGIVATQSGTIQWESRIATIPAVLAPIKIQQGEKLITQGNGNISVQFSKSGTVLLSPNTEMDFIQTLPQDIVLVQSSGVSEIIKTGSVPITTRTYNLLTQIDSGDVSISLNALRPIVTVSVASGSATVAYNDTSYYSNVYNISAGQSFIYNYNQQDGVVE